MSSPGTANLISWWSMDETSGTRADSHGSNDLTDNNTVGSATAVVSNGADFEASNSEHLSITDGSQTGLDLTGGSFSWNFWWKPESISRQFFIAKASGAGYTLEYNGGSWFLFCNDGSSTETSISGSMTAGNQYMITVTNDGANWELFINGSSQGTNTTRTPGNSSATLYIGSQTTGTALYIDGVMDELAVFDDVLTSAEITWLYNSGSGRSYSDLTAVANEIKSIAGVSNV